MTPSEAAQEAYAAGLCVIPPLEDGSKAPISEWKEFQTVRPTRPQMSAWYGRGDRDGIGVICGVVSGGLECTEFDDHASRYEDFKAAAIEAGIGGVVERIEDGYLERSAGGGIHWFYFCEEIGGNQKLAGRHKAPDEMRHPKDFIQVTIETRGEGGFTIIAPSRGGVHPSGNSYDVLAGSLSTIATITPAERKELHRVARTFDELPPKSAPPATRPEERTGRPGDDFNGKANWEDILAPHGWQRLFSRGEVTYWRRPGKHEGISASTNHAGSNLFYVWSSSTEFETERGYSPFSVYALLEHAGNFEDAAKRLASEGYGERRQIQDEDLSQKALTFPHTDAGQAELFVHLYGERVLFDWQRKRFYLWKRHRWEQDSDGEMDRLSLATARVRRAAAAAVDDKNIAKKAFLYGLSCESHAHIEAMKATLQSQPEIKDSGKGWDSNPALIGVENGVIHLPTGEIRPGKPGDRITMTAGIIYDPEAKCPRWLQYLAEVFEGNRDVIAFIQRAVGYSITGSVKEQVFFLAHGHGQNGKSIFLSTLGMLAGEYATNIAASTIKKKPGGLENHPAEIASLVNRRIVTCSETPEGASLDEARVKSLTGGDIQTARFMRGDPFTFLPVLKMWLATNHLPKVEDDSEGFWRRMRLIPFNREFKGAERDNDLEEKLRAELAGIFAWAVQGAVEWYRIGLRPPASVMTATTEYRNASDPLADFMTERCIEEEWAICGTGELYKAYQAWANTQGMRPQDLLNPSHFGRRVSERYAGKRSTNGARLYKGIRLRYDDEELPSLRAVPSLGFESENAPSDGSDGNLQSASGFSNSHIADTQIDHLPSLPSLFSVMSPCSCSSVCAENPVCAGFDWWESVDGGWHCPAHHEQPIATVQ